MIKVEEVEKIRRAYFLDEQSIREIARTLHHSRRVIRRAIESAEPGQYRLAQDRPAPVLGPWKEQIDALWTESQGMPRKQRYTARKIYQRCERRGIKAARSRSAVTSPRSGGRAWSRKSTCPSSSTQAKMPR